MPLTRKPSVRWVKGVRRRPQLSRMLIFPEMETTVSGNVAMAVSRGDGASFVAADEVDNYPHTELLSPPRRQKRTMWAWFDATRLAPPQDGTELVMLANLISDYGDGQMDCEPICARVRWSEGAWVDYEGLAIVPHPESQRLVVLYFMPAPTGN